MREAVSRWTFYTCCAINVALIWAIDAFGAANVWNAISGQTAAAWVQAAGSIAAILGTAGVMLWQHKLGIQQQRHAALEAEARRYEALHRLAGPIYGSFMHINQDFNASGTDVRMYLERSHGWLRTTEACAETIERADPLLYDRLLVGVALINVKIKLVGMTSALAKVELREYGADLNEAEVGESLMETLHSISHLEQAAAAAAAEVRGEAASC